MSTSNKIVILLVLIAALLAGWFYMNKSADTAIEPVEMANSETEAEALDAAPALEPVVEQEVSEAGTVTVLPADALLGQRGVGDPNAPVKIKEYFSLTCNHCADFHKTTYQELKAKYIDTGKVYFVYEEFPLNGPALYGSMIARCLPTERYPAFVDLLLRNQESWAFGGDFKASLLQNAKLAGMSEEEFETCFNNKDLQKAIANNISAASDAYKVTSTPSFVLNDGERLIRGGKSIDDFSAVIDALLAEKGVVNKVETIAPIAPMPVLEEAPAVVIDEMPVEVDVETDTITMPEIAPAPAPAPETDEFNPPAE